MTNALFLNKLETLKDSNFSLLVYESILNELKIDIAAETNKETTTKQRINIIDKNIKNGKVSQKKPILSYYSEQLKGYKTFADSYIMCALKDADFNGLTLENENTQTKYTYPSIDKIIDFNFKSYDNAIVLKVNDILNDIKKTGCKGYADNKNISTQNVIYNYIDNAGNKKRIGFAAHLLKLFLVCMNCSPSDTITLYFKNNNRPAFMENKNGSIGLILPIYLND